MTANALPVAEAPPQRERSSSAQSVWGWGAVGLGGAGLVTGGVLTVLALNKKGQSHDRCPRDPCDAEAVSLSQDAALATGVILLLTDGSSAGARTTANRTWEVYPQVQTGARAETGIRLKGLF